MFLSCTELPVEIWNSYQACREKPEIFAALERVIFGDDGANSQRAMKLAWVRIEKAREKRWSDFLKESGDKLLYDSEKSDRRNKYETFSMQLMALAGMVHEDFSKILTQGQKEKQLKQIVKVGRQFVSLLEECYLHPDYFAHELEREEMEGLITRVSNEYRVIQLLQDVKWGVAHNANMRDFKNRGEGYLYTDEFTEKSETRQAIISDYEQAIFSDIIPLVVKYVPGNWPVSLSIQLGRVLDSVDDESKFVKEDSCILTKVNIRNPRQTYMIRYLSDCFYTIFRENDLATPMRRVVGAMLCKQISILDMKDGLRGYQRYGIRNEVRELEGEN